MSNPVFQQLPSVNGNSPLSEEEAASLLSQISVSNPPSEHTPHPLFRVPIQQLHFQIWITMLQQRLFWFLFVQRVCLSGVG